MAAKTRLKPYIFLASQSPRRSEILRSMHVSFETAASGYEEAHHLKANERPSSLVRRHAKGKALHAKLPHIKSTRQELVLGADTIVYFQGRILGKPRSYREAEKTLMGMSGKSHTVYTGIALLDRKSCRLFSAYEKTRVTFHSWDQGQIKRYVKDIHALDKAGSYAIQMEPCIVKKIQGSRSNVIGLPKELLSRVIRKAQGKTL